MRNAMDGALYNVAVGSEALMSVTTGDGNVTAGYQAGNDITTGEANVCIGNRAGDEFDAENYNIFIGEDAGGGAINGADKCIAIGKSALDGAITQDGSIAIGHDALGALTSGSGCTAVGFESLDANDTGIGHTAFGYQSLSAQAGATNGTTAIGHKALHQNNYGGTNEYSVAVGFEAGDNQTSGFKNTFLGASTTAAGNVSAENQIVIGYHAAGIGNNYAVIGNDAIERVYAADDVGATLYAGCATVSTSDRRIKENIENSTLGISFINQLVPITYKKRQPKDYDDTLKATLPWHKNKKDSELRVLDDEQKNKCRFGFIAQDVEKILTDMNIDANNDIVDNDSDTGQYSLAYSKIIVPLVKAVQELSAKVTELENK